MNCIEPTEIKKLLFSRLDKTKEIIEELSIKIDATDNLDISSTIYFKYYFDFSSAIETVNRNILIKKYGSDEYITEKEKINNEKHPLFIDEKKEILLVNIDDTKITLNEVKRFYSEHILIIGEDLYSRISTNKTINEYDSFFNCYKKARDIRNRIAHSLVLANVNYDNETLLKYMISFYCLYTYYENLK